MGIANKYGFMMVNNFFYINFYLFIEVHNIAWYAFECLPLEKMACQGLHGNPHQGANPCQIVWFPKYIYVPLEKHHGFLQMYRKKNRTRGYH